MQPYEYVYMDEADDTSRASSRARWRPVGCLLVVLGIIVNAIVVALMIIIPVSVGASIPVGLIVSILLFEVVGWGLARFLWRRFVRWRGNRRVLATDQEPWRR